MSFAWRSWLLIDRTAWLVGVTAIVIYLPGLCWGLPHATSEIGKHGWDGDSVVGILTLAELHNLFIQARPDWYVAYPLFHYLVLGFCYVPYLTGLWLTGGLSAPSGEYPYGLADPVETLAVLALVGRLVTLFMACGIVVAAYLTARTLWDRTTGVLAAAAAMLTQPMFYYARTGNLDVPVLFWTAVGLYMAARILTSGFTTRRGAWLGVVVALAVATKDQAYGAWVFGLVALVILVSWRQRLSIGHCWPMLLSAAAVYGLASGLILSPKRFVAHVRFILDFNKAANVVVQFPDLLRPATFRGRALLLLENSEVLLEAVGPVLLVAALAGLWMTWRGTVFVRVLIAMAIGYAGLVLIPVQHVQYRYLMFPAYVVAFPAARALVLAFRGRTWTKAVAVAAAVTGFGHMAAKGVDLTYQMLFDARQEAGLWLAKQCSPGDQLTFFGSYNQLPALPRGVQAWQMPKDASIPGIWQQKRVRFVLVIPDFSSSPGMEWNRFIPEPVYKGLNDGSLGYEKVAHFRTPPLLGRPLKYLPFVNSSVQIYTPAGDSLTGRTY